MGRPVQDGGACLRSRSAVTSDGGVQALVTTSEAPATDSAVESALGIEAQVDELFSKWDRPDTPGAALGVVRGGELVLERYYGCADLEVENITPSDGEVEDLADARRRNPAGRRADRRGQAHVGGHGKATR